MEFLDKECISQGRKPMDWIARHKNYQIEKVSKMPRDKFLVDFFHHLQQEVLLGTRELDLKSKPSGTQI